MSEKIVRNKSFAFSVAMVDIARLLREKQKEYLISNQMLKSGTAIAAMIREAEYAESRADFLHKMAMALKEANETEYWLELLFASSYIDDAAYAILLAGNKEIIRILVAITKTTKQNLKRI